MKIKSLLLFSFLSLTNILFANPLNISLEKAFFLFIFLIFVFSLTYGVLKKANIIENNKLNLTIALSVAFLIIMILRGPFAKYFVEVVLPFMLFTIFLLILIYIFFQAVGIKFGSGKDDSGFINVASNITMWVGLSLLLIVFIASLKKMGYSIVDKMLQPSILGILVFALVLGFIVMTIEK
jgi:hypothetical protein